MAETKPNSAEQKFTGGINKEIDLVNRDPNHINEDVVKVYLSPSLCNLHVVGVCFL